MSSLILEQIENDIRKEQKRAAQLQASWEEHSEKFSSLLSSFDEIAVPEDFELRFHFDGELNIFAKGDGNLLTIIFRTLRLNSFVCTGQRPGSNDAHWSSFFEHPDIGRIWFSFSSTICKITQVGTELKEMPIYRTECGHPLSAEPDESFNQSLDIPI